MRMEFTLETVAAMLSLVGYGLNDTIVNFDRIREHIPIHKTTPLPQIVNRALNECLCRTVITSLTTILAIAPMALFATGSVRDFAIIMSIGVVWGSINSIFISGPMFLYLDKWFKNYQKRVDERKAIEADLTTQETQGNA
jgi:preprotein translocase SecF subunit